MTKTTSRRVGKMPVVYFNIAKGCPEHCRSEESCCDMKMLLGDDSVLGIQGYRRGQNGERQHLGVGLIT